MFLFLFLLLPLLLPLLLFQLIGQAGPSNFPNEPAPNAVFGAARPPWRTGKRLRDGDGQSLSRSYDHAGCFMSVQGYFLFLFSFLSFVQDTSLHGAGH
jgi:hypothetical protein